MEMLWNFREPKKCFTFWAIFLVAPVLVNVFVDQSFVSPQRARLRGMEETKKITVLKPKLEVHLAETNQLLSGWDKSIFTKEDPSRAMQVIQKLGAESHVEIQEIRSKGQKFSEKKAEGSQTLSGYSQMSMDLEVRGSFSKLLRWMNEVEKQTGLEIDSWKMISGENPGDPHKLTVNVSVFLK